MQRREKPATQQQQEPQVATFIPINDIQDPVRVAVGVAGPSGTGKTYSAMRMARGMAREIGGPGAPFALIDAEDGRGRHYRADFPEALYTDFRARDMRTGEMVGFPVERWMRVLDDAEREGINVLAVDSASHSWEGINGVLDRQAAILNRLTGGKEELNDRRSQLAWAEVKPEYRRFVERLTGGRFHVVVCSRAKPVMQKREGGNLINARSTKLRDRSIPWDIAGDADLIFNMTVQVLLSPEKPGRPGWIIKAPDGMRPFFDSETMLDENLGRRLIKWAKGDMEAARNKGLLDAARDAARKGEEALRAHYAGLPDADKYRVRSIMDELKDTAAQTEERLKEDRDGLGSSRQQQQGGRDGGETA